MSRGRITSIVIVALLHALLGYAFVTGLAYNVVKQVAKDLKTFDVIEEPPPVVAPPPIVRINTPAPIIQTVRTAPPPVITPRAVPAPPAPVVAPAPPKVVEPAAARGDLRGLFTGNDYPSSAQSRGDTGTVRTRLTVGTNGRVTDCTVTSSSGSSALDSATCRILRSRARFTPARDNRGQPISDTVNAPPIVWRLSD